MNKQHWPLVLGATGWFSAIYWLAERGTFVSLNKPPVAVGLAFTIPILLFLVTERISPRWRARVTSVSPVLLISIHIDAWVAIHWAGIPHGQYRRTAARGV